MTVIEEQRAPASIGIRPAPRSEQGRSFGRAVPRLAIAAGSLGTVSSLVGLLWRTEGSIATVIAPSGARVDLYGRGLYSSDTLFVAANNFATDLVFLLVGLPLLVIALRLSLRGSDPGRLLLLGVFGYLVYHSASYALGGVAYNELFLVYVAFFAAALFGFIVSFGTLAREPIGLGAMAPRRLAGRFMIASGAITLGIWLMEPVEALLTGELPASLETHTTLFTNALDIAVIVPAAVLAGVFILRGNTFGYTVAFSLLVLEAMLFPIITIATLIQLNLGIEFEPPEIFGPIAGFTALSVISLWVIGRIFRALVPIHGRGERER